MRERARRLAERVRLDVRLNHATQLAAKAWHLVDHVSQRQTEVEHRVEHLERLAVIDSTMRWIERADVPNDALVSVVTVTRDRSELLARAVESLRAQRHERWELLLIDDRSDPHHAAEVRRIAATDDRIVQVTPDVPGLAAGRNAGRRAATGEFVTYLDDDNELHPLWLSAVVWGFRQRPDVDVLIGARIIEDVQRAAGLPGRSSPSVHFDRVEARVLERRMQSDIGCIGHRSSVATESDERFARSDDWDWLQRVTRTHAYDMLPCIAMYYGTSAANRLSEGVWKAPAG